MRGYCFGAVPDRIGVMRSMVMRSLSKEERYEFYHNYLVRHFHKSEVKSFPLIERLVQEEKYLCYGFFEADCPLGYAFFAGSGNGQMLLLDYYAILEDYRSRGLGGKFVKEIEKYLAGHYTALIAEVENPDYSENEDNRRTRERRIQFYRKNGFRMSRVLSRVLTDEYNLMYKAWSGPVKEEAVYDSIQQLYRGIFSEEFYRSNIHVRMVPNKE